MSGITPADLNAKPTTPQEMRDLALATDKWEHNRMLECRCRNKGSCLLLDNMLGWNHGMPPEDCDVCLQLGGEHSLEANRFREAHAAAVVGAMTKLSLESPSKPPRDVLVQLTIKHKTISEERFKAPDIQNGLRAAIAWTTVKSSWEKAGSFLKALASRLTSKVSHEDRDLRQQACFGRNLVGTIVSPPCQMLRQSEEGYWCGACGCGDNKLAIIGSLNKRGVDEPSKLDFPALECPLSKPGFSNGKAL